MPYLSLFPVRLNLSPQLQTERSPEFFVDLSWQFNQTPFYCHCQHVSGCFIVFSLHMAVCVKISCRRYLRYLKFHLVALYSLVPFQSSYFESFDMFQWRCILFISFLLWIERTWRTWGFASWWFYHSWPLNWSLDCASALEDANTKPSPSSSASYAVLWASDKCFPFAILL